MGAKRITLDLPELAFERLQRLQRRTEAASWLEVSRNAYRIYEALLDGDTAVILSITQKAPAQHPELFEGKK